MTVQVRVATSLVDDGRDADDDWLDVAGARHLAVAVGQMRTRFKEWTRHVLAQVAYRPDGCPTGPAAAAAVAVELDWLAGQDPDITLDEARGGDGRILAVRYALSGPGTVAGCRTGEVGWWGYGRPLTVCRRQVRGRTWGDVYARPVLAATRLTQQVVTGLDGEPVAVIGAVDGDGGDAVVSDVAFGGPSYSPGAVVVAADPSAVALEVGTEEVTVPWSAHFADLTFVLAEVMRTAADVGGRVWWRDTAAPAPEVAPGRYC